MTTRPCPNCGASLPELARFCGQCGTTIAAPAPAPNVHEEVTVARAKPDLSAMKTIMDAMPAPAAVAPVDTPLVPAPETQGAAVVMPAAAAAPKNVAKTMMLGQTLNDPDAEARAREMRDAALGEAATAAAAPLVAPKANLHKTMMMGGDTATPPHGGAAVARSSDRPTAPTAPTAPPEPPGGAAARGGDASPLSKSVMAPGSWHPPGLDQTALAPPPAAVSTGSSPSPGTTPAPQPAPAPQPEAAPAPAAHPAPATPAADKPALRTMLGMPASALGIPPAAKPVPASAGGLGSTMAHPGAPTHPPPGGAAPAGGPAQHNVQKTMLGVAIPGIAPTHGAPTAPTQPDAPAAGPKALKSEQSTMLGVAIPGIAPSHASAGVQQQQQQQPQHQQRDPRIPSQVQNTALGMMAPPEVKIVPRPKTLIDEPLPAMPQVPQKRGIPAVAVVGIVFAIVLVAGGAIAFLALRNSGALTAVPQLDENGRESLKIGCTTCPDGTTVSLGASKTSVVAGAAVLPLPAPLSIGDNDLTVKIERPGGGRNEDVKVHVPVAYRVRADLSTLAAPPGKAPAITVRIEATPGSTVTVDEKPITLDATGRGSYAIDLAKETEGEGEAKTFERKIPFAITPKGGNPEKGELTARTSILPLAMDAPGRELITDKASAAVAGQTRPGSTITIDGQNVPVDPQGRFGVRVELSAVGEKPLEIVASAPPLAPRVAKVKVTRVASLEAASKGEDAHNPITYDVFGAEPASKTGQRAVVEGEVVEARSAAGHTTFLIDEKKKCAKGASCLVRVGLGDDSKVARGDTVRAYGRILGAVTASGKTVPDLEGTLVLPLKTGGK